MKARLIGVRETQGVFEGKPYHSIKMHCTAPCFDDGFIGEQVLDPKRTSVSFEKLPFVVGCPITYSEFSQHVGEEINIDFDLNQRVVGIQFTE